MVEDKKTTKAKKTTAKKTTAKKPTAKKPAKKVEKTPAVIDVPRVKKIYIDDVVPILKKEFGYKNPMQVPTIKKIVVNIGIGEALDSNSALNAANNDLMKITGQKPKQNRAKVSIANFKLREGSVIGTSVTLRGKRMWQFYDRLVNIALPRIKDFKGLKDSSCDKYGNFSFGIKEHIIFPEVNFDRADKVRGLDIVIVISSKNKEHSFALLKKLNFPFIKKGDN